MLTERTIGVLRISLCKQSVHQTLYVKRFIFTGNLIKLPDVYRIHNPHEYECSLTWNALRFVIFSLDAYASHKSFN